MQIHTNNCQVQKKSRQGPISLTLKPRLGLLSATQVHEELFHLRDSRGLDELGLGNNDLGQG